MMWLHILNVDLSAISISFSIIHPHRLLSLLVLSSSPSPSISLPIIHTPSPLHPWHIHGLELTYTDVQVDYAVTAQELESFFQSCGVVERITIACDKYSGHPKGFVSYSSLRNSTAVYVDPETLYCTCRYAYVEFTDSEAVANAMLLNESEFHNRQLKVCIQLSSSILLLVWTTALLMLYIDISKTYQRSWLFSWWCKSLLYIEIL